MFISRSQAVSLSELYSNPTWLIVAIFMSAGKTVNFEKLTMCFDVVFKY